MSLSTKRAQQLQDLSRVLLGLAIALQHTASHEAKLLTHHVHLLHHSNKNILGSTQHYADAALNTAQKMATTFTPPRSTSSQPSTPPPSATSASSAFTAPSPLSSVLPSGMDIVLGVSKVLGTIQSLTNVPRPPTTKLQPNPSPYPSSPASSFPFILPSGADIAVSAANAIGAVQSVAAAISRSSTISSPPFASPYLSSSSSTSAPPSPTPGPLSSVLPSGADIASNVSKVIGALQSSVSTVSSLSTAGATAASHALPLLSSLPLSQLATALVSSALPPGVPRPSAEQVNAAVNAVLSTAQQLAQQLTQQASNSASPITTTAQQQPVSGDNMSPYPSTTGSSTAAAADSTATIQPPSFVNIDQPSPLSPPPPKTTALSTRAAISSAMAMSPTLSHQSAPPSPPSPYDRAASDGTSSTAAVDTSNAGTAVPSRSSFTSPAADSSDLPSPIDAPLSPSTDSSAASTNLPSSTVLKQPKSANFAASIPPPSSSPFPSNTTSDSDSPLFDLPPPAFLNQQAPTIDSTVSSRSHPSSASPPPLSAPPIPPSRPFELRSRTVPSTPIGRVLGFGGIAMRMLTGTVVDATKRIWTGDDNSTANPTTSPTPTTPQSPSADAANQSAVSRFLSPANTERLAEGLCRMRGAALKIGQMLSIQDDALLPPPLAAILARVRDSADMMPQHQLHAVLRAEWGDDWSTKLQRFDEQPIAAASIGQVHRGSVRGVGEVVVKVQYPGVADSIESDVENVRRLINWFNIAPKGLYLDKTMDAAKEELSAECDYRSEAVNQTRFRQLLRASPLHPRVGVPAVVEALCTRQVLVSEWVSGVPIDRLVSLPQSTRDALCRDLVQLCLLELFVWRFMQTDPNWSNFLYDHTAANTTAATTAGTLHLVDFGACIEYRKPFIDDYLRMVHACAERDRSAVVEYSRRLGFITGEESREMLNAHVAAALIIGEPFSAAYGGGYDFAAMNMSGRVSDLARVMVRLRLTAPPKESYTLHRKLSGCFLTCKKLQANVSLRDMFMTVYRQYQFD